ASALLLPAVTVPNIFDSKQKQPLKAENSKTDVNSKLITSQVLERNKSGHKSSSFDHGGTKSKIPKAQIRNTDSTRNECIVLGPTATSNNHREKAIKRSVKPDDNSNASHQTIAKSIGSFRPNQSSTNSNHGHIRSVDNSIENSLKDQSSRKFSNSEFESGAKSYSDYSKGVTGNHQEYKSRNSGTNSNPPQRFSTNSTSEQPVLHRDCNNLTKGSSRNDTNAVTTAQKALEQHNLVPKMGQINFPPLRAPQSIVNVRHPFVTESRIKQNDMGIGNCKQQSSIPTSMQSSTKDLDHNRQTFHGYSTSPIANIPNVQSLSNITGIAQYPRPDSFPQQTLASLLFPESSQFPQSPSYGTPQVGQINQFQAYDPGSFTPTPVNVNSVIPQFTADNSPLSYPQFESPQFVQTNHYSAADMANTQYQYQAAGVGQIPESPLFIQSLQSPLTVTDQYATPNYAQAVRAELVPRLRRPPRFNK
ncbi:uncharacterized protein LOC112694800, partial [Athalia rosae]|uniref:uncharacterized protein LOC112694800 n=1 Tax=Athalia rosae TaxID=37344 RepID=UPI0020334E89